MDSSLQAWMPAITHRDMAAHMPLGHGMMEGMSPSYGEQQDPAVENEEVDRLEFLGLNIERRGRSIVFEAGSDFDHAALRDHLITRAQGTAASADEIIHRLLELLTKFNTIHLVGQVAARTTVRVAERDDADERLGSEARVEYLGGLALAVEDPDGELAGPAPVEECFVLLSDLFDIERARIMAEELQCERQDALGEARFVLRLESLLDRTQGYVPHLESIARRLFEPLTTECIESLGFSPADIPLLLEEILASAQDTFERRSDTARAIDPAEVPGETAGEKAAVMLSWVIFGLVNPVGDFSSNDLSDATGIERSQVESFLEAFSSEWRSQPEFQRPGDVNVFRRRPSLRGHPGRYSVPLPWSILHEVVPWFKAEIESRGLGELRASYLRVRGQAVEALVVESLSEVFGSDRVHANVEYPIDSGNWAELDTLVTLGGHAIILEAKSNALHDAYRRGDTERIEYHLTDLLATPFGQTGRASRYLLGGGTRLRYRGTGQVFEISPVDSVNRVAVSLERIDPLVLLGDQLLTEPPQPVWIVALPDLLMVCEILDTPEALVAYATKRTEIASIPEAQVYAEVDLLGSFVDDRLGRFVETATQNVPFNTLLGHHAEEINIYFTDRVAGLNPPKPGITLDEDVQHRLQLLYRDENAEWYATAVEAVFAGQIE